MPCVHTRSVASQTPVASAGDCAAGQGAGRWGIRCDGGYLEVSQDDDEEVGEECGDEGVQLLGALDEMGG